MQTKIEKMKQQNVKKEVASQNKQKFTSDIEGKRGWKYPAKMK
ncbi:hypothetical protein [Bacillus mycoides]|nr:hypothetical protein [Bacillus mycoides]